MGNHILTDVYPDLPKTIDRSLESNRVNASHKLMMIGALRDATSSLKTAQKKRRGKNSFQPGEKLMLHRQHRRNQSYGPVCSLECGSLLSKLAHSKEDAPRMLEKSLPGCEGFSAS